MKKADRIRRLLHLSNAEVARRTGESIDYIRAVRQRTDAAGNARLAPAELKYREAPKNRARRRAQEHARYLAKRADRPGVRQ